jgi:hypothetical protein
VFSKIDAWCLLKKRQHGVFYGPQLTKSYLPLSTLKYLHVIQRDVSLTRDCGPTSLTVVPNRQSGVIGD